MDDSNRAPARGLKSQLKTFAWATTLVVTALLAVLLATGTNKLNVPGAPVVLHYVTLAVACLVVAALLPPIYRRLPRAGRIAAFVGAGATVLLLGAYAGEQQAAWERTPQGAREAEAQKIRDEAAAAAAKDSADELAELERRKEEAKRKLDEQMTTPPADSSSASSSIDPESWTCDSIKSPVIAMSRDKPVKILEIDDPKQEGLSNTEISCTARAELSNGASFINYGAHISDGGQLILTYEQN